MKGKTILILLFTIVAFMLMAWEIIHSFSHLGKKRPAAQSEKKGIQDLNTSNDVNWKHYSFQKRFTTDSFYSSIVSSYPKPDTLYPTDILPKKQLRIFADTLKGSRLIIFRPTSSDGYYGEWIVLTDFGRMYTRFNAVKIDTAFNTLDNKKIFVFKKQKTNVILKDTIYF